MRGGVEAWRRGGVETCVGAEAWRSWRRSRRGGVEAWWRV